MAQADEPCPIGSPGEARDRRRPPWATGMICVAILPLMGFIGQTGRSLWGECAALGSERSSAEAAAVIGYIGISPRFSFAARPPDWKHEEGGRTLLWAGWSGGKNHWFSFGKGELDGLDLSFPLGRDVIQAIDQPIFQGPAEPIWARVPDQSLVVPLDLGPAPTACPLLVLDKVEVLNGLSGGRPVLIAYTPLLPEVDVYDARHDGRQVTMGHSGFFDAHRPILYDRATESLWVARDGAMTAVAGPRKGASLRRIGRVKPVSWGSWKSEFPDGRLVVGAERPATGKTDE